MKKYPFSIIFFLVLLAAEIFKFKTAAWLSGIGGRQLLTYVIYGVSAAIVAVFIMKAIMEKKAEKVPELLLSGGLVFYFLLSRQVAEYQLGVLEFFLLGFLICFEGRKSNSLLPSGMLLLFPLIVVAVTGFVRGGEFYLLEFIKHFLYTAAGYVCCKAGTS